MPDLKKKGNSFPITLNADSNVYSTLIDLIEPRNLGCRSFVEDTTLQRFYTNCLRTEGKGTYFQRKQNPEGSILPVFQIIQDMA